MAVTSQLLFSGNVVKMTYNKIIPFKTGRDDCFK